MAHFDFTPYRLQPMPGDFAEIHDAAAINNRHRVIAVINGLLEPDEQIAFTRLFAAAPDLLAACNGALWVLDNLGLGQSVASRTVANQLRTVIAKAEPIENGK
jgi:hypothetical protein